MHCLITAGPTFEPLDNVRRLTNFSTGRLGATLAGYLMSQGHQVTLLIGEQATYPGPFTATSLIRFTTTSDLLQHFQSQAGHPVDSIFHAAAVSDFGFGRVMEQSPSGEWVELRSGKITTRGGALRAELIPTPKLLPQLRGLFPRALIVGWKFEVDGGRLQAIERAQSQIQASCSDACVVNGAAYGEGFGILQPTGVLQHVPDSGALFQHLATLVAGHAKA